MEQSVIDDGIDQWYRCLHAYIRTTGGHFRLFTVIQVLTVINEVKIYC